MSKEELKAKLQDFALKKGEKYSLSALDDIEELGELMVAHTDTPFDDMGFEFVRKFKAQAVEFLSKIHEEGE